MIPTVVSQRFHLKQMVCFVVRICLRLAYRWFAGRILMWEYLPNIQLSRREASLKLVWWTGWLQRLQIGTSFCVFLRFLVLCCQLFWLLPIVERIPCLRLSYSSSFLVFSSLCFYQIFCFLVARVYFRFSLRTLGPSFNSRSSTQDMWRRSDARDHRRVPSE